MNMVDGKARAAVSILLLTSVGIVTGTLASSLTTDAIVWRSPEPRPTVDAPAAGAVDQASAGQAWARSAFDGGLRQCPPMNETFLAACETEMTKLAQRPALPPGSYGDPLLITRIVPAAYERSGKARDQWEGQHREPQPEIYWLPDDALPADSTFEPTPDNYPAMQNSEYPSQN